MVQPSQKWLDKFNDTLVPEMFVKIVYSITEPGLQEDATPSTNGEVLFSNVSSVVDNSTQAYTKYATGELNFTQLDGTYKLPPESVPESVSFILTTLDYNALETSNGAILLGTEMSYPDEAGYISEFCVTESKHPTVTLSFSKVHTASIPGISIVWSTTFDEWATSFKLTAYSGSTIVSTKIVSNNADVSCEVDWDVSGYDSISIEVLEWCLPNRRARIEKIQLGRFVVFEKNDIFSYKHESTRDPISGQLPNDCITFTVDNSQQKWNPINPEGLYKYLYERQSISVEYGMDLDGTTEWITGGKFFLSEWSVPSNSIEASFTARDAFGYLMASNYTGRMYGTLYEMAYDALELLSDNIATFQISDELKNYSTDITKQDKSNYKDSDILQMVANAAGMAMYQTRDGTIVIDRIPDISVAKANIVGEISIINNFSWPEITFFSPLKNVTCSIDVKSGDSTTSKTVSYPESATGEGATQSVSNEMLSESILAQPRNILTESYKILSNRRKASLSYRASPHFDALDYVLIHHQFGYSSVLLTTNFTYEYSGCFHGTVEGYMLEGADVR